MQTAHLTDQENEYFRVLMGDYGLEEHIPLIEPHLETCILLEIAEKDDYSQVGNTRRCGWPDFPPDWTWPVSKDRKFLNFLSQINLAEIAPYQDVLPRRGILYFFIGGKDFVAEGHIRFYDGDLNLLRKFSLPEPLNVKQFSLGFRPDFEKEDDDFLLHNYPRKIVFHPTLSIPPDSSRLLLCNDGTPFEDSLSDDEAMDYIDVREILMYPPDIYKAAPCGFYKPTVHQRVFGYEYCQTFEPRDFGKHPCEGSHVGIELYTICDHDEVFRTCLDGTILFSVKQDELAHCQFSEYFVAIEG